MFQMTDGRMQTSTQKATVNPTAVPARTVPSDFMLLISAVPAPCTEAMAVSGRTPHHYKGFLSRAVSMMLQSYL